MVHTLPDGTTKYRMVTIFGQIDSGELAARLDSPVKFDRRGNVVSMDDFEGTTLRWNVQGAGAGYGAAISTDSAFSGSKSCKMTAGAGEFGAAYIYKYIAYKIPGKVGYEFSFTIDENTFSITLRFEYYNGSKHGSGKIRYLYESSKFQYLNSGGGWTDLLTSIALRTGPFNFHTMKLVIDTENHEYVRFLLDNHSESMADIAIQKSGSAANPSLYLGIEHTSEHADAKSIYIDDIIITQNEP